MNSFKIPFKVSKHNELSLIAYFLFVMLFFPIANHKEKKTRLPYHESRTATLAKSVIALTGTIATTALASHELMKNNSLNNIVITFITILAHTICTLLAGKINLPYFENLHKIGEIALNKLKKSNDNLRVLEAEFNFAYQMVISCTPRNSKGKIAYERQIEKVSFIDLLFKAKEEDERHHEKAMQILIGAHTMSLKKRQKESLSKMASQVLLPK